MPKKKKLTSESLLGIIEQPEDSCYEINEGIANVRSIMERSLKALNAKKPTTKDKHMSEALKVAGELEDQFEYCRLQCIKIRQWGQEWKNLAKAQIKVHDPGSLPARLLKNG